MKKTVAGLHKVMTSLPLRDPEEGRSIDIFEATRGEALHQDVSKDPDVHQGNTGGRLTDMTTFVPGEVDPMIINWRIS